MSDDEIKTSFLHDVAADYIKERRRKRRWGIFFKTIFFLWLFIFSCFLLYEPEDQDSGKSKPHVGLVEINGAIFDATDNSADKMVKGIRQAFQDKHTIALILKINSPGGSPVQASYVYKEIKRFRKLYPDIKVYAVCSDLCASAAYYIAAAADEIYADQSSLVGSIGVLYDGFGFVGVMNKVGVERRLITSGKNKGMLDPFSPQLPAQTEYLKNMLTEVHQEFIARVKEGRGKRLSNNPDLFTGLFWTGVDAKKYGLIDGFGSAGSVARDVIKNEKIVNYTVKPYWDMLAKRFGEGMSHEISSQLGLGGAGLR